MKSVAFCTLGCKVNQYETDAMTEQFARAGYEVRSFSEIADIYVVNTCTVTNIADRKSRQMLRRARKRNPDAIVVAAGCYVQAENLENKKQQEKEEFPETAAFTEIHSHRETIADSLDDIVDIMIGNDRKGQIVEAVEEYLAGREMHYVPDIRMEKSFEPLKISEISGHTRAYIKVQDGCNQFCSYCLIPYVRGRIRSRDQEEVLQEVRSLIAGKPAAEAHSDAEKLTADGICEIVLTGIHISSYGLDWAHENSGGEEDYGKFGRSRLIELLEALSGINGLARIRLSSLEPRIITEDFVRRLSEVPQICPHFHLSLQSGCDETLARMNRHYTTTQYLESCQIIRKYFPHAAITTDVIAGFPGETEEEFAKTCEFVQQVGFADMHIFRYSKRKGTRAASMPAQVSPQKQELRSNKLIELAAQMQDAFLIRCEGSEEEVLLEEPCQIAGKEYMTGYSKNYVRCLLPMQTAAGDSDGAGEKLQQGQIVRIRMMKKYEENMLCEEA